MTALRASFTLPTFSSRYPADISRISSCSFQIHPQRSIRLPIFTFQVCVRESPILPRFFQSLRCFIISINLYFIRHLQVIRLEKGSSILIETL